MPSAFDSYSFTIMSYSASTGQPGNIGADFYPTTPMYYDLVAIQLLYGERPHNDGNTTYTFFGGQNYWQTIDNSGGKDTIVYNGSDGCKINLAIGQWSDLGLTLTFPVAADQTDTVMIGPRSLIENATGGSGNDFIFGNGLANRLNGSGGGDSIFGYAGNDLLNGGPGRDVVRGGTGKDAFAFNKAIDAIDSIRDFSVIDDTINLAKSIFGGIGRTLSPSEFGTGNQANNAQQHIVYNAGTGALIFDRDGAGGDPGIQFATLGRNLALGAGDFIMT